MTRSTVLLFVLAVSAPARAQLVELPPLDDSAPAKTDEAAAGEERAVTVPLGAPDASIESQRAPLDAVSEHFLGSTSRAVRFDWRRRTVTVGVLGSEVLERNTFGTFRVGASGRKAFGDVMVEAAVTYFHPVATEASEQLSLTPYRQAGRPWHLEIDVNAAYPLAEGVVTPVVDLVPPAELAFFVIGGVRYLFYPRSFVDQKPLDTLTDLALPALTAEELRGIEPSATPAMLVDTARYHTLVGLMLDASFQPGVVVSPRALIALPVLAPVTGTRLGLWWELSLFVGFAF